MLELKDPFTVAIPITVHPAYEFVVGACLPELSNRVTAEELESLQQLLGRDAMILRRNDGGIAIKFPIDKRGAQPYAHHFNRAGERLQQSFLKATGIRSTMIRCSARDVGALLLQ